MVHRYKSTTGVNVNTHRHKVANNTREGWGVGAKLTTGMRKFHLQRTPI
jgi:hypothetical protein